MNLIDKAKIVMGYKTPASQVGIPMEEPVEEGFSPIAKLSERIYSDNAGLRPKKKKIEKKWKVYETIKYPQVKPLEATHSFPKKDRIHTQLVGTALYVCFRDGSLFQVTREAATLKAQLTGTIKGLHVLTAEVALVCEDSCIKKVDLTDGTCTELLKQDIKAKSSFHAAMWNKSIIILSCGKLFHVKEDGSIDSGNELFEEHVQVAKIKVCQHYLIINEKEKAHIWDLENQAWHKNNISLSDGIALACSKLSFLIP